MSPSRQIRNVGQLYSSAMRGGHDADNALVPAFIRQHDCLRRAAGREHGDGRLIDAAFNLLPPAVESAKRPRQFDRARSVVRQE